jgi:hypothetical protein
MSIKRKPFYFADCDRCKKGFSSCPADFEHELFETREELVEQLEDEFWEKIKKKWYCPKCSEKK